MIAAQHLLRLLSSRLSPFGKSLLVMGDGVVLAAIARQTYGMRVKTGSSELSTFDVIYVADDTMTIGDSFLNRLSDTAWLIVDRRCMAKVDERAVTAALWFETIGGIILPEVRENSRQLRPSSMMATPRLKPLAFAEYQ